jgi:hypothetical protein
MTSRSQSRKETPMTLSEFWLCIFGAVGIGAAFWVTAGGIIWWVFG